ncbi:MAG TPA: hypothetical protein VFD82_06085 [Planctomycetota bacterium]|nr:hypothetical protein [Planctomycetota bacterium]
MARFIQIGAALVCFLAGACNTPSPRPWLRFEPVETVKDWTTDAGGTLVGRFHGADVHLDLANPETRVQVTVGNNTAAPIEFRIGPEAGSPGAIGEVLLRPIDGPPGVTGPPMLPYAGLQPQVVDAGWRGTFYLNEPLGRAVTLGQTFVLTVEARNASGAVQRRSLLLAAKNAGTIPLDKR